MTSSDSLISSSVSSSLLPLMSAAFNLRECAKQMILLEDHLFHRRKRCEDCIRKHFLTIEALAEEGAALDGKQADVTRCDHLAQQIRELQGRYMRKEPSRELANRLRVIRKGLVNDTFNLEGLWSGSQPVPLSTKTKSDSGQCTSCTVRENFAQGRHNEILPSYELCYEWHNPRYTKFL